MSFSQHLVLWLHVAFVIFTIGPATLAIMSTPRYIRQRDLRILRYLSRMTVVFAIGSLGVLIAGLALASMLSEEGKPWVIVSATLFLVAIVLLILISRDQRHAIRALEAATSTAESALTLTGAQAATALEHPAGEAGDAAAPDEPGVSGTQPAGTVAASGQPAPAVHGTGDAGVIPAHLASVERGRIAMLGGVVSLIWLVILVLMVWNS
jgi:Ca2+/Na+ antiporter